MVLRPVSLPAFEEPVPGGRSGPEFQDITAPKHAVEVDIREDGSVLWVHVDGVSVLRICRIPNLIVNDGRTS